ncbi:MAG: outer membrane protein assembly factor BamA [Gammaproteobacteria bacterium]|nr:outer membrane protein assembly factor BamA [Gammaproteobacteria bacterium]
MKQRWLLVLVFSILLSNAVYASERFTVKDIRIIGLERIADGTLLNYLPVQVGEVFDTRQTGYVIQQLYKTGFFKSIELGRDEDVLVITVIERPAIAEVKFDGNNDIADEQLNDILKDLGIIKGRVFNPSALERIEQGLKQQAYFSQGKYGVRIDTRVNELERNRVSIDINISEGVVTKIKQVNLIGNKVFDNETLLDELQLGVPGFWDWFSSKDEYARPKLSADLETLQSFYQDKGYIRFNVDSTQVSITPDKKDIYITVNLTEGEQYHINEVNIIGDMVVDKKDLTPLLRLNKGELFSRRLMIEGKDLLNRKLGNEGYAFSSVQVMPKINDETREVDITYMLVPGKKAYVRRIVFSGNYKTQDEVLRRELRLMEGSELSNSKLERSKIRLQRLSFVEEVVVDKVPVAGADDLVDLIITVTERLSGSFNVGMGYSQNQGFVFNLGLQMENLMGTGQKLSLNFNNDDANKVYSASFTDPYYTVDGISRTIGFSYRERDASEESISNYVTNSYGVNLTYGIPLTEYDSIRLGIGYEHMDIFRGLLAFSSDEVVAFLDDQQQGVADIDGHYSDASFDNYTFIASYTHDTRNRTVFASRGSSQSIVLDATIPGSDLEFYKLSYNSKFYFPVTERTTLLMKADFGYGDGYGQDDSLPFFERFFAGGLRTVRGFDNNSLGLRDEINNPRGGDLRTVAGAEYIFPVPFVEKPPGSVRLSAFYDIGNVFLRDEAGGFDAAELRSSTGVSFVWLAPIGPLRFSWAKPLEKKDGDDTQVFQFTIGSFF